MTERRELYIVIIGINNYIQNWAYKAFHQVCPPHVDVPGYMYQLFYMQNKRSLCYDTSKENGEKRNKAEEGCRPGRGGRGVEH